MVNRTCWIDDCGYVAVSWGMCGEHREAWDKLIRIPRTRVFDDADRFEHYTLNNPSKDIQEIFGAKPDCIIWGGGLNPYGYSQFRSDWSKTEGGSVFAHLYAWVVIGGNSRNLEHETDHRCRFRPCVNQDHLEQVPQKVNTLRGVGPTAKNAQKTHCDRKHEFTKENTFIDENGWRHCRECNREDNREYNSRPEVREAQREAYIPSTGIRGRGQYMAEREACDEGHKLEGDNLLEETVVKGGKEYVVRRCRECRNKKARENHAKRAKKVLAEIAPGLRREDCITSNEVADLIGVKRTYLPTYRKRTPDFPQPVKTGKPSLFSRQEILDWHNANKSQEG